MNDLLKVANPEGGFSPVEDVKGSPVSNKKVLENIKESLRFDIPVFSKKVKTGGSFIFVAGGSTLREYLSEIRLRKENGEFICTSNMTHDYLVDNGIIPDMCLLVDPKKRCKDYIKKTQKETIYVIGVVANPEVFENLIKAGCEVERLLVAYGIEDESDIKLQEELYKNKKDYLVGGTMTGLRAMPFALMNGFSKIEYYGFDSCFSSNPDLVYEDDPRFKAIKKRDKRHYEDSDNGKKYVIDEPKDGGFFYAYKKPRGENIQIAETPDGKRFLTSNVFAHQAKQFIKWVERMDGKLKVVVHGDSLSSAYLKSHIEKMDKLKQGVGDKRWTDKYAKEMIAFHKDEVTQFGQSGYLHFDTASRGINTLYDDLRRNLTVLDYGCGKGSLKNKINSVFKIANVTNYDPFIEEFDKEPEGKFDLVVCNDVMEHTEIQCVGNVLNSIRDKTKYMAIFTIALDDAKKELPDGRNTHITLKNAHWWLKELAKKFIVVEAMRSGHLGYNAGYYICQSIEAVDEKEKESITFVGRGSDKMIKQKLYEFNKFCEKVDSVKPEVMVEIGILRGGIISHYEGKTPTVIGIDKVNHKGKHVIVGDSHDDSTLQELKKRLDQAGRSTIDVLFIDGDHSYEGVKKDYEMYAPLVRKGGIVAFHDIINTIQQSNVNAFWGEIKAKCKWKKNYFNNVFEEIIDPVERSWGGIGVLYV